MGETIHTRWGLAGPEVGRQLDGVSDADRLSALLQAALTADSPDQWQQNLE